MKKYVSLLFIAIMSFSFWSCNDNDNDNDNDNQTSTYAVVYDYNGSFSFDTDLNSYAIKVPFKKDIPYTDYIMVYRKTNASKSSGTPVWEPLPLNKFLPEGKNLEYRYDFSKKDTNIYADGNFTFSEESNEFKINYLKNQTFRIVIAPASDGNKMSRFNQEYNKIDFKDYNAVAKYFNINEAKVIRLK